MRTVVEIVGLARAAGRLWWRFLAPMTFWYAVGFTVHQLGNYLSVLLGAGHHVAATLVFVVGLVGLVAATVLTIQCCGPAVRDVAGAALDVPAESRLEVLSMTIGPFLAAYALWGLVQDEVSSLFVANVALTGLGGVDQWSVNLQWVRFYLVLAVIAWVARQLLSAINRRVASAWLLLPTVLAEGLWVVASFLAAFGLLRRGLRWLEARAVWQGGRELWYAFLDLLPDLRLPFDLTLPQALTAAVDWLWQTLLPGLASAVLLPLVWLALTATVFGWREASAARAVTAGSRVEASADRMKARLAARAASPTGRLLVSTGGLLTADVRAKFLSVAHAFRLVLRAGPRFVGAYLVLAAAAQAVPDFGYAALDWIVGPQSQTGYLVRQSFTDLVVGWLGSTLAVAVYVAAFSRVVEVSGGTPASAVRIRAAA